MQKTKSIEELVRESLESKREEIIKNGIAGVQEEVSNQVKWKIGYVIEQEVETLFKDEEVKVKMSEEIGKVKVALIESFAGELQKILPSIASGIAQNLLKRAIKNLTEDNYSMNDLYKKLFSD